MSVPDWRQPQGLRGMPGFETTRRAEFATWTASGQAAVPVGGGRAWPGFETTRQANDQQPRAGGVEAAAGPAGPGRGAGGRRQGQGGLSGRAKLRPVGGCRGACGAWPRCRRAAAGPGRASRSITPSRRLACGDLAGGPPPPGTTRRQARKREPRATADSSDYSPARRSTSWMMRPQMALTHAIAATPRTRERQGRISRKYSKP